MYIMYNYVIVYMYMYTCTYTCIHTCTCIIMLCTCITPFVCVEYRDLESGLYVKELSLLIFEGNSR